MVKIKIFKNKDYPILAYENALMSYVYGRVTLNSDWFLALQPSIFFNFHHAIEVSVKTLLRLKSIGYRVGADGHKICLLLSTVVNTKVFSDEVNQLVSDSDLMSLLNVMDQSYIDNKYEFPGYEMQDLKLRQQVDKIIYVIFQEINLILKSRNHALAAAFVPEPLEMLFLYKLETPILYSVMSFHKD